MTYNAERHLSAMKLSVYRLISRHDFASNDIMLPALLVIMVACFSVIGKWFIAAKICVMIRQFSAHERIWSRQALSI